MRPYQTLILCALLFAAYQFFSGPENSQKQAVTEGQHEREVAAVIQPSTTDQRLVRHQKAGRKPAAIEVRFDPRLGRPTMKVAQNHDIEAARQSVKERLARYRIPASALLAGAEAFELMKLKAVPAANYRAEMGELIEEKLGFAIFAGSQGRFDLAADGGLPVVAKKGSGLLGIVTGTLIVTLKDGGAASPLARQHQMDLKFFDPDLKLAYYTAPSTAVLDQLASELEANANVENVTIEIVQSRKRL